MKRAFDVVISGLALVILAPFLAVLALAVKLGSAGPCLYRGSRVGWHGKNFSIIKLRTMVSNADRMAGGSCTASDDQRITRIGRSLRRYKLDEIPQLFNVLRGDMSLVGPRPEVQEFVDLFTQDEREILTVRPGITDWATLWNADEESLLAGKTDPEQSYLKEIRPGKLRLQLKYVHERSFSQDLSILLQTSRIVVSRLLGGRRGPMSNLRKSTRHPQ